MTKSHAVVQLGQSTGEGETLADIAPDEPMRSRLSADENTRLLKAHGLEPVEMRLVKSDPKEASEIFHILCRKV